jgi:3-deoxy-D-manno-octulosonic-acid transferase
LLNQIHLNNVTISGDTRFDRVAENALKPASFEKIEAFCADYNVFVAGSTWPEDEKLICNLFQQFREWKFIIAPHEIREDKIGSLIETAGNTSVTRYSKLGTDTDSQVLVIDNIGMLSSLYQYADVSYIGGGFGVGIHNTLEAAAFGIPVIFGPNYGKFREAKALINLGAAFSINNVTELNKVMQNLKDQQTRTQLGDTARQYVLQEKGATETIMKYVENLILKPAVN